MPSSSLLWSVGSLAVSSLVSPAIATAAGSSYHLLEAWQGKNFLDYFDFFDGADPTNGFVTYTNQSYAQSSGLFDITESGSIYMGVDSHTTLSPNGPGRESVRIESKRFYDEGLYVFDIKHMPGSICGTWPAFWSVGPSWPEDGEIDIIEGVNKHDSNKIVLHTSGSCDVSGSNDMSGTLTSGECGEASGTIGCVVQGAKGSSGDPFNQQGGGVYAMEWTAKFIKIWFFPRASIPASLQSGQPNTAEFGTPMAHLQGSCNFHERFKSQKFIIDTTFCGDWAGGVFGDSTCPLSDPSNPIQSCVNYVAQNPEAFKEAYWEINSIKLYQEGAAETTSVVSQVSTTSTVASSVTTSAVMTSLSSVHSSATSVTQAISSTTAEPARTETAQTDAPVHTTHVPAPSNPAADATGSSANEAPKPTDAPAGSDGGATDDGDDEEPVSRSTFWVTETTTFCPLTKGGSIATTFPAPPAQSTTEVQGASPTGSHVVDSGDQSGANKDTVPAAVPTVPAAESTVPAAVPTAPAAVPESPAASQPAGQPSGPGAPPVEGGSGSGSSGSEETVIAKPSQSVPSSAAAIGSARPSTTIFGHGKPSSSGFVPVPSSAPTTAAGVATGSAGSAPSATTPSAPMFTGAANTLRVSVTGVVCALAMAFLA
ncbi:concanavalin A-like lectin/glucanase domain-containing protein [Aspergillus floccosus]